MKILISPEVLHYLNDLVDILYEEGYFSYLESSEVYVEELIGDIANTLQRRLKKPAPSHFDRYGKGMSYAVFKKNNNTQWYVFFHHEDDIYYVRYIGNNHTCAQYIS